MKMNRRNVLIGLGTIVAGGGAALGTGAFSSVEANRTVTVDVADDASAFLGLQIRDDLAAGENTIDLDLANAGDAEGINENAKTVLDKVLLVENNGTQNGIDVTFSVAIDQDSYDGTDSEILDFKENNEGSFDDGSTDGIDPDGTSLDSGQTAAFDLEIDLREDEVSEVPDLTDGNFDATVTITAEESN